MERIISKYRKHFQFSELSRSDLSHLRLFQFFQVSQHLVSLLSVCQLLHLCNYQPGVHPLDIQQGIEHFVLGLNPLHFLTGLLAQQC